MSARRSVVGLLAAALAVALAAPTAGMGQSSPGGEASGQAGPGRVEVRILSTSQRELLRTGQLRVRAQVSEPARVTLTATGRETGSGASTQGRVTVAKSRTVRFERRGARTVRMALTSAGRRIARACTPATITVSGRAAGAGRAPAFTGSARTGQDTERIRRDAERCLNLGGPRSPLRAGSATSDITPPIGTPMFAYTARQALAGTPDAPLQIVADPDENLYAKTFVPSRGIHTRVRARALVLQTRAGKFALVQADLGGLPYALVQEVLKRVQATGITGERLLISATHTHSSTGPIWPTQNQGYALLGGDAFDPRIFRLTADGIARAILAANGRLAAARLGIGTTRVTDASSNRSFDEAFRRNADVPRSEAGARAVSIDPQLTVIRVDTAGGRPLGAWSNFAIHPTSFGDENLLFSGDNAAFAERISEQAIRSDARRRGLRYDPDRPVVNVWTNASEGDISPNRAPDVVDGHVLQYAPNSFTGAHLPGARVGQGIVRAWRAAGRRMSGSVRLGARRTFVDFNGTPAQGEPVGPVPVLGAGGITGPDGFCAPIDNLAGPGQGRKFPQLAGLGLVPQVGPVSVWRVESLGIAAFPSEITKQMGVRIRAAVRRQGAGRLDRVVLAGLTNGYQSYTSTPEEYDACNYEGSFTLWGRRQGPRYVNVARPLASALLAGTPAPPGAPEPAELSFGSPFGPPPRVTPRAGEPVQQPAAVVRRLRQATFRWRGGDPSIDAPQGRTFVSLERQRTGGAWTSVATDDSFLDTAEKNQQDVWTEKFQFEECVPTGAYRFAVTGVANRGAGAEPYRVTSNKFELRPNEGIRAGPVQVRNGVARVTATYPDPGEDVLLALPRIVRSGHAVLRVRRPGRATRTVRAEPDARRLAFTARVPAGAAVDVVRVEDGCGNVGR